MSSKDDVLGQLLRYAKFYPDCENLRRLVRLRRDFFNMIVEKAEQQGLLTRQGQRISVRGTTSRVDDSAYVCRSCEGHGLLLDYFLPKAQRVSAHRVDADVKIDQCPVSIADLARRVAYIYECGDITGKSILCLGDDDLTSLLIAQIGRPREIVVVDIDQRILDKINACVSESQFPLKTLEWDVARLTKGQFPPEFGDRFDVFVTDPPYTDAGFKLFLAFGMIALKRKGVAYTFVPHMHLEEWSDELLFKVEEFFIAHKFVITEIKSGFQTYLHPAGVITSVVRAERLGLIKDPYEALSEINLDKLYTLRVG